MKKIFLLYRRWKTSIFCFLIFICAGIFISFFLSQYVYKQQVGDFNAQIQSEKIQIESYLGHADTLLTFNYQKVRANKISSCTEYITNEDRYNFSLVQKEMASVGAIGQYLPIQEIMIYLTRPQIAITSNTVYSLEDMSSLFFQTEKYKLEKILSDLRFSDQSEQIVQLEGKEKTFNLY